MGGRSQEWVPGIKVTRVGDWETGHHFSFVMEDSLQIFALLYIFIYNGGGKAVFILYSAHCILPTTSYLSGLFGIFKHFEHAPKYGIADKCQN